jgi:hypothetical protein
VRQAELGAAIEAELGIDLPAVEADVPQVDQAPPRARRAPRRRVRCDARSSAR